MGTGGGVHQEDGDKSNHYPHSNPTSVSRAAGSWVSGQSLSTSGSVGSPSSRSELAVATPATADNNAYIRFNHLDIHADDAATQDAAANKKKRRGQRTVGADKGGRGLRQFSMKVCEKVESKGTTTYNEVADELVAEFADPSNSVSTPDQQQYDEKNIRRRVYDALNVLMALDIISKDKKEIQWKGLPRTSLSDIQELKADRLALKSRIEKKAAYLQELEEQFIGLQNLIQRNEQLYSAGNTPSGGVSLPFILVQTRPHATVEVEISEDMQLVHFDFNSTPFELHDDNYVLKAMKFCERPGSDDPVLNPANDGGEGSSSMSNMHQQQSVPSQWTDSLVRPPTSPPLPGIIKARVKGNPNITIVVKAFGLKATVQVVDLQVFASPRISLKPLVPTFPCFANIYVSLLEKPHVDFGLKVLGADAMSIPGLYRFVQELIKDQVANMYLWPKTLVVPIMDPSKAMQRPVGILSVKVVRAMKLRKKDLLGASDPYVKLKLTEDKLPSKKTTVKHKNLNPEWNEEFNIVVKDPESQALEVIVYDWEQVGKHDKMGMNVVPLKDLTPDEAKVMTLDLLKNMDPNDVQNEKSRGQLVVELLYKPFKDDEIPDNVESSNAVEKAPEGTPAGGGLLVVIVHEAQDVEGKHHTNPFVRLLFRGEERKTKYVKKNRDPRWEEEFQFMLEEPPTNDKLHVEVISTSSRMGLLHPKETLGYVLINLADVVSNKRINEKYHLIDSRNGRIQIELQWRAS